MKLVTYALKEDESKGLFVGVEDTEKGEVLDLAAALDVKGSFDMKDFLMMGSDGLSRAKTAAGQGKYCIPLSDVIRKAPIDNPEKLICIGMNYADHCTEQDYPIPEEPTMFSKFASAIANPGDDIVVEENQTKELDFEVEMVIVIGKEGKAIKLEDAMEHVVGYTVAHDVSARDWQLKRNGGQWLYGKTMDGFAPLGPSIVTTDEVQDPHSLGIRCFLNGEQVQNGNTKELVFKTEALVVWCSRYMTLRPGDLIFTGTPCGVGCFRKPQLFLKHGDVVKCEIDKIGAITNTVRVIKDVGPVLGPTKYNPEDSKSAE